MELFQTYAKEIVALVVPFITWLLASAQRGDAKLIRGVRHAHTFTVDQPLLDPKGVVIAPKQYVYTASVIIQNSGRKPATNVELVFEYKPMQANYWPLRDKTEKPQPDGRHVVLFNSLAPGEWLGFELLSVHSTLPALSTVRCDQGMATEVRLVQQKAVERWKSQLFRGLILLGTGAVAYLALIVFQFLILKTPATIG